MTGVLAAAGAALELLVVLFGIIFTSIKAIFVSIALFFGVTISIADKKIKDKNKTEEEKKKEEEEKKLQDSDDFIIFG